MRKNCVTSGGYLSQIATPMTPTIRNMATLRYFIRSVERAINLRAPIAPDVLACTLGLDVHESPGTRFALRLRPVAGGGVIMIDSLAPTLVQGSFIARACASYLLRRSGLIKSGLTVGDVAAALCAPTDGQPVPLFE